MRRHRAQDRLLSTCSHLSLPIFCSLTLWLMLFLFFLLHQLLRVRFFRPLLKDGKKREPILVTDSNQPEDGIWKYREDGRRKYGLPWIQ